MSKFLSLFLLLCLCGGAQAQDIYFHNAAPTNYKVQITLPNGAKESGNLGESTDSITSHYFNLVPGIAEVKVDLLNEQGISVYSGVAKRNASNTFFASGQGVKMVYTGFYGGTSTQEALFMNDTGEALTVDLIGANGLGGVRGIVPPSSYDPSAPVKLDPREASYEFAVSKDGVAVPFYNDNFKITPGLYYLLRKDSRGLYRFESFGHLKQ